MINKRFSLYLLLFLAITGTNSYAQGKKVFLSGIIKNSTNQMQVIDASAEGELSYPDTKRTFVPDSNGNFSISFELDKPCYFLLGFNLLYLSPNDHLKITIDAINPEKAQFKGDHEAENNYLKSSPHSQSASFLDGGSNIKPTIKKTVDTILIMAKDREKLLNSYSHLSLEFKTLEKAHLKADVINSLKNLPFFYHHMNHIQKDSICYYDEACKKAAKPYLDQYSKNFINSRYLELLAYRAILSYLLDNDTIPSKSSIEIEDYQRAKAINGKAMMAKDKAAVTELKPALKEIINPSYKSIVSNRIDELLKFGKGDTALDFMAMTINEQPVNLKAYAGKVIFIDIWATWCGPCMKEIPYLEKLKDQYKNNPDVVFISLSIDDDKGRWKKEVMSMKNPGNQWNINIPKLNDYSVYVYPTTIIIDKNFKVSTLHGPLPSSPQTQKMLDELLLN